MLNDTADWARSVQRFIRVYLAAGAIVLGAVLMLYLDFANDHNRLHRASLLSELGANLRNLQEAAASLNTSTPVSPEVLEDFITQRDRLLRILSEGGTFQNRELQPVSGPLLDEFHRLQPHWNKLKEQLVQARGEHNASAQATDLTQPFVLHQHHQQGLWQLLSRERHEQHNQRTALLLALSLALLAALAVAAVHSWRLLSSHRGLQVILQRQQQRLRDYIDLAEVIFVLLDSRGHVHSINKAGSELLNLPREQIIGKNWFDDFIPARERQHVKALFERIMHGEAVDKLEYLENHIVDANGDERLILWHNTLSRDDAGTPVYAVSAGIDITDLKTTQLQLSRSERKYRTLLNTLPYGVQEISTDGTIVYSNPRHDTIYGYPPGQMRGMNICELPADEAQQRELAAYLDYLVRERPAPQTFHSRDKTADGRIVDIEVEWDYLYDENHQLSGFISVLTDITQEVATKQALAESEARFREIMEHSNQIYWLGRRQPFELIYVSPQLETIWGLPVHKAYADPASLIDAVHPEDRQALKQVFDQWSRGSIDEYTLEHRIQRPDGLVGWVSSRCYPIYDGEGQIKRFCGVIQDISLRKRAEQEVRDNEAMLRQITESINEVFFMRDTKAQNMIYVSSAYERIWACPREELYEDPRAFMARVHPEDKAHVLEQVRRQDQGGPMFNAEYRIVRPDGEIRWIWARTFPIENTEGEIYRVAGLAEDITERKQIEQAVQASEQKYRALINQASDPVLIADMHGNLLETNARGLDLFGYTHEEFTRLHVSDIHPPHELPRIEKAFKELREEGNTLYSDGFVLNKAGETIPIEIAASRVEFHGREVAIGIFRDIRTRKRLETERLRHERQQRETLVREVHHRIKNNLQGVIGLLRENIEAASTHPELLNQAIDQIRTIAVVYGLQAKASSAELRFCDITEAIVQQTRQLTPGECVIDFDARVEHALTVHEEDAVPFALIINELITNAIKHTPRHAAHKHIEVELELGVRQGHLRIHNRGAELPQAFSLADRRGLGLGLELILSLLPHQGAYLEITQTEVGVEANLYLDSSIVDSAA